MNTHKWLWPVFLIACAEPSAPDPEPAFPTGTWYVTALSFQTCDMPDMPNGILLLLEDAQENTFRLDLIPETPATGTARGAGRLAIPYMLLDSAVTYMWIGSVGQIRGSYHIELDGIWYSLEAGFDSSGFLQFVLWKSEGDSALTTLFEGDCGQRFEARMEKQL